VKERWKGLEDEKEDVSIYWMTLREKPEYTGILNRKHEIALSGELAFKDHMVM